jgi:hypothetical protein
MEEYEVFSKEFMKYWKGSGTSDEIKQIQANFNIP